jgi:hypothetical protein
MMRAAGIALVAVLLAAAAPVPDSDLPIPPLPPDHPPIDVAAPVPNADAHGPAEPLSKDAKVGVELYRAPHYDPSLGFAPGSRFQTSEDRKPIQTPGISVRVPWP